MGPTSIHGLTASDVFDAPRFVDIAGNLTELLRHSNALAGHNVRFDVSFLQSEYRRIGVDMPSYRTFDTMRLAGGGSLSACCAEHDITFDGRGHSALHDARATAHLLRKILLRNPDYFNRMRSLRPSGLAEFPSVMRRSSTHGRARNAFPATSTYVGRLAERLSRGSADPALPEGETEYRGLLWRVLEDGRIEESECESLIEVATHWGLSFERITAIHLDYLSRLATAAWADHHITETESRELQLTAQLLGFGTLTNEQLNDLLHASEKHPRAEQPPTAGEDWTGKTVCFTGECCCSIRNQLISREVAEQLAASRGLRVQPGVTKKLDILVVSDPNSQSSKAKKARQYGTRILHEPVFWRSLGIMVD